MRILKQIFTWWNGQTLGTRLFTARNGIKVGTDDFGNTYYHLNNGERRWVIYADVSEASTIPPDWHGWLHHIYDMPPTKMPLLKRKWEKPHQPNMTGTLQSYHPPGSLLTPQDRDRVAADYEAWTPN